MDPNYLSADSTVVQQQLQQGKIAMTNLWASRGGAMDDPQESTVVGKIASGPGPDRDAGRQAGDHAVVGRRRNCDEYQRRAGRGRVPCDRRRHEP